MKIKHIFTFFIVTYLIVPGQTWSMSNNTQPNTDTQPVIEGDVFLIPSGCLSYVGYNVNDIDDIQRALGKTLEPQDVLVNVWVTSNNYDNWAAHGHPSFNEDEDEDFPQYLPLYLLDGKNEEDIIEFLVHGKLVRLRCKQIGYRYQKDGNFGELLNSLKGKFGIRPLYQKEDKQRMIQEGILAVDRWSGGITNGPKDYIWLMQERAARRRRSIAWLMSGHQRLGQESSAAVLPQELRRSILELASNK